MHTTKSLVAAGATLALSLGPICIAHAADMLLSPQAALVLAHQLSAAAANAERSVSADQVSPQVALALQNIIIRSGSDPRLVLMALQDTMSACRPPAGRPGAGWSCPASASAFDAVESLETVVLTQLDQTGVASLGSFGNAPFGTIPLTSPGGAGYIKP